MDELEILKKARKLLVEQGPDKLLRHGAYVDETGCFCGLGAVMVVDRGFDLAQDTSIRSSDAAACAMNLLDDAVRRFPYPLCVGGMITVNDRYGYDTVIAVYDKAIEDASHA